VGNGEEREGVVLQESLAKNENVNNTGYVNENVMFAMFLLGSDAVGWLVPVYVGTPIPHRANKCVVSVIKMCASSDRVS